MQKNLSYLLLLVLFSSCGSSSDNARVKYLDYSVAETKEASYRLPNSYFPEFGVQNLREEDFATDSYKSMIDEANESTPYNFLIPFLRFPHHEVVDTIVHDYVKRVAEYASKRNVQLVPDLDIRNARRSFMKKYPDEMQQMLRIREIAPDSPRIVGIRGIDLNDHYSGGALTHHIPLESSLLRVYSYGKEDGKIHAGSIRDITADCKILHTSSDSISVEIPPSEQAYTGVMAAFTHLYPDVFAPHLMEFQQEIIRQYADTRIIGVCKDEWGFPPYYPRFYREGLFDFWYSEHRAKEYLKNTGGRELLSDCLLMAIGISGKENEREAAVNRFMEMSLSRNTAIEDDFYKTVKEVFGKDAIVSVHSTWWPYPDRCEYLKNGLDWWAARRDWAQTDEVTPCAVRTSLCKKWGSPVWYNMYYKSDIGAQVWSSALGGGRIDYLPYQFLFRPDILQAECRVRLLNYITESPLDCRVAVIFGHYATMNWAHPEYFDDAGMEIADSLWHSGYPADLIPSTEITNGSLSINADGKIRYGTQLYDAAIFYHPEYEDKSVADFFRKANNTALIRIGEWTKDFNADPLNGDALLPSSMRKCGSVAEALAAIYPVLEEKEVMRQSPATIVLDNTYFNLRDFTHSSFAPPTTGFSRLVDGTVIHVAGTDNISGDTLRADFTIDGRDVHIDAVGIAAIRLDNKGRPEAIAAAGLKYIKAGDFEISLDTRIDLALWRKAKGKWEGVVQAYSGEIPAQLSGITADWSRINIPVPPQRSGMFR
jgi:hypothetical protein